MKKWIRRIVTLALVLTMSLGLLSVDASASGTITSVDAYNAIIALQDEYPEGMEWTNADCYVWYPYPWYTVTNCGCAGFAAICSDAAFGDITGDYPLRGYSVTGTLPDYIPESSDSFSYDTLRAGDILRTYGNSHSVVVLERYPTYVVICEGNFNSSIHWGRTMSREEVERSAYVITRYPEKNKPAVISSQPVSVTAEKGVSVKFTVKASNAAAYRWQYNDGSGWANIPENFTGYNTKTLKVKALLSRNGWRFRCKVKGTDKVWIKSSSAKLRVTAPAVITSQPASVSASRNNSVKFTVKASNALAYRWQYNDGSGWANVPENFTGYNAKTLKVKAIISRSGWKFRCKVKGYDGVWVKTNTVKLTVKKS